MKKILIYISVFIVTVSLFGSDFTSAAVNIPWGDDIRDVSLNVWSSGNAVNDINSVWFQILSIVKRILMWLMVIYMVYTGAMMIMSMGSDEEQLSSAKRQIWYAIIALVFINIPGSIYRVFYRNGDVSVWWQVSIDGFENGNSDASSNIFVDFVQLGTTLNNSIVFFLEMMIFLAAVFMITLAGIKLMTSRGREENMKEAKNKIVYTILALIFVGLIEAWKRVAFDGEISDGVNLFESILQLALFFAVPVAVFFLTLSGYYFITSNGDEERVKKAKSIIINTLIATLILLAGYTFLLDFTNLSL